MLFSVFVCALSLVLGLLMISPIQGSTYVFSTTFTKLVGASASSFSGYGVVLTSGGDLIIAGHGNAAINGQTLSGSYDMVVMRMTNTGTTSWTRMIGSSSLENVNDVTIDSNDNVYVAGRTIGTFDGNSNAGNNDWAMVSYTSSGTKRFSKTLGGTVNDYAFCAVYSSTNSAMYAVGYGSGTMGGYYTGSTSVSVQSIAKYSISGTTATLSSVTYPSSTDATSYIQRAVIDSSGNLIYVGFTQSTTFKGLSTYGASDITIGKQSSSGTHLWAAVEGGTSSDSAVAVCVDSSDNVYVTGYSSSTTISGYTGTSSGSSDIPLYKYNSAGTRQFGKLIGGSGNDYSRSIAYNGGYLYLVGYTTSTNFPGASSGEVTSGNTASYVMILDTSGNRLATKIISSSSGNILAFGIAVTSNNIYVTGYTSTPVNSVALTGTQDMFVVGMSYTTVDTASPTRLPTAPPTFSPTNTGTPSQSPTYMPTKTPTFPPSAMPSAIPSAIPSNEPTFPPTATPTYTVTVSPTELPTVSPTAQPSTGSPTVSPAPSAAPTAAPTVAPSSVPTYTPTAQPTTNTPTLSPTNAPTAQPTTSIPTHSPTNAPTAMPTQAPTLIPTLAPTDVPTLYPTLAPSATPTVAPTDVPTASPTTASPSLAPTAAPTAYPTEAPTTSPSPMPTFAPTQEDASVTGLNALSDEKRAGAISGIVIGVVLVSAILLLCLYFVLASRRRYEEAPQEEKVVEVEVELEAGIAPEEIVAVVEKTEDVKL